MATRAYSSAMENLAEALRAARAAGWPVSLLAEVSRLSRPTVYRLQTLLAHLDEESFEADIPVALVLDQDDPLATARVIGRIGELGPCALVDPYFTFERLPDLIRATQVERVLTSSRDPKKLEVLRLALGGFEPGASPGIRTSDVFHDRFVIPDAGPIWLLGTSLTGLGKRLALMVEVEDETVSSAIRTRFEEEWSQAAPVREEEEPQEPDEEDPEEEQQKE